MMIYIYTYIIYVSYLLVPIDPIVLVAMSDHQICGSKGQFRVRSLFLLCGAEPLTLVTGHPGFECQHNW